MKKPLLRLLLIESILSSAASFAGSFVLIYLLSKGFSYVDCGIFILLCFGITTLICIGVSRKRFQDLDTLMIIGIVGLLSYYILLIFIEDFFSAIFITILFATYIVFFWVPFNIKAVALTSEKNRGLTLGIILLIFPLVAIIFPTLGGLVIREFGYLILFLTAASLLLINAIFVYLSSNKKDDNLVPIINFQKVKSMSFGLFCEGAQEGIFVVTIPLFGFEFTNNEFYLGILLSIFTLTGGIMTVFLGYISDKIRNRNLFLRMGALITAPFIVLSAISKNLESFTFYMALANFTLPLICCFLFVIIIDQSSKKEDAVLTRELMLNFGRSIGAILCVIGAFYSNLWLPLVFSGIFIALSYIATLR